MSPRALISVPFLLAVLAGLPAPAAAAVEKGPGIGLDASSLPLAAPDGDYSYRTRGEKGATRLLETARVGGQVRRELRIPGGFALPAVAYDGLPSGLSADGRTLILVNPRKRFPRASTTLAVVDPKRMRLRRQIRLSGDFSFDAISPDGRLLYLIQYLSPRDVTDYAVRAYDMRARRTAVCIDLDIHGGDALAMHGDRVDVLGGDQVLASIDTSTHRVIAPAAKRPAQRRPAPEEAAGFPWLVIAGPAAALMLLAGLGRRRSATRSEVP
jgi:hypothetical protein